MSNKLPHHIIFFITRMRPIRFAIIGVIVTIIHFMTASACIYFIHYHGLWLANILGFMVAYVFSYLAQSHFVFCHKPSAIKASKYFLVQFFILMVATELSTLAPHLNPYIRTLLVVIIMPIFSFLIHKFWTFRT